MRIPTGIELKIDPSDRVLLLYSRGAEVIAAIAAKLTKGLLVCVGEDDAVRAGRRECRDLENVMFVHGSADEIPWQDHFFDKIIAPAATAEITRVLAPNGRIVE